jgi:hypothetical protein
MDLSLRYYSPAFDKHVDDKILVLLERLRRTHGIATKVVALRMVPSLLSSTLLVPDEGHAKEIFERDFLPCWRALNDHTGMKISSVLRSKSGSYFVAGTIAVVSDLGVEWYATGDRFAAYDADAGLGFLKALQARGPALLDELWSEARPAAYPEVPPRVDAASRVRRAS